jgi:hypothetical protein
MYITKQKKKLSLPELFKILSILCIEKIKQTACK